MIVFDVNETLSDMSPLGERFTDVGAPEHLLQRWFAMLLRDGFALTAVGTAERFAAIGEATLRTVLTPVTELDRNLEAAVEHVMAGFMELPVHPDVPDGVRALRAAGYRLVTLTNGSTEVSEALLRRAGIREHFEALMSVEDAGAWKPARAAYAYAAQRCGVDLAEMLLVAVHPWDLDGASRAGLATAWIDRTGAPYPGYFTAPSYAVRALTELPGMLAASSGAPVG